MGNKSPRQVQKSRGVATVLPVSRRLSDTWLPLLLPPLYHVYPYLIYSGKTSRQNRDEMVEK